MSLSPGLHKEGMGGAERNPCGVERLEKRETGKGESDAEAWASRYCPGAGINSGGQAIRAEPSKKISSMLPEAVFIGKILTCFMAQCKTVIIFAIELEEQ